MLCQIWWVQARHQSQPSAISATPATRNVGGCLQVPHLPREKKVDVAKCHTCHGEYRGVTIVTGDQARPSVPKRAQARPSAPKRAQTRHQSQPSAIGAKPATQNQGGCHQAPGLPCETKEDVTKRHACHRETKVDVAKCHACHAKYRGITGDQARASVPKRATRASPVP